MQLSWRSRPAHGCVAATLDHDLQGRGFVFVFVFVIGLECVSVRQAEWTSRHKDRMEIIHQWSDDENVKARS